MNVELLRELGGEIPLLTHGQLRFLDDFNLVVENTLLDEDTPHDEEQFIEIIEQVSAIEENLRIIIGCLRGGEKRRRNFLETYPIWKKVRDDGIEKSRQIAQAIQTDRFNCNVSKLVGYCTSFVGGAITLASAIAIPFTFGLTTPLAIAGGSMTAAGCAAAVGTAITEIVLLKNKVNEAQEILKEDNKYFKKMSSWLEHAAKLEEALSKIMQIDIVKDIIESVEDLVDRGMQMRNDFERLNFIRRALNEIINILPRDIRQAIPLVAFASVISVLVAVFLLLRNTKNRLVFECASATARGLAGIVALADDAFDLARFARLFISSPALTKDLTKALIRGGVAVLGMALDVVGITLASIDIHKGSLSPEAEKIIKASEELEEEAKIFETIYNNISLAHPI